MSHNKSSGWQLPEPRDDGLFIPVVGDWSARKHHYLSRYLYAFVTAMRTKRWSSLHYVDLFAGAGLERLEQSQRLDWGSPMIAAQVPHPFSMLHVCELDPRKYDALSNRLARVRPDSQTLCGDSNSKVEEVVKVIPPDALSIAFLDPYGLHLEFSTIRCLAQRRMDLVIFFPDHLDALRNCEYVYRDQPDSNLDRALGPGVDWRTQLDRAPRDRWAQVLRELYSDRVRSLGYLGPEIERISQADGRFLYLLLFFSKSEIGLDIWRRASLLKGDSQRTFDFGSPPG